MPESFKSTPIILSQIKQFRPIDQSTNCQRFKIHTVILCIVLSPDKTIHNIHYAPFVYRCPAEKITPIDARPVVQIDVIWTPNKQTRHHNKNLHIFSFYINVLLNAFNNLF